MNAIQIQPLLLAVGGRKPLNGALSAELDISVNGTLQNGLKADGRGAHTVIPLADFRKQRYLTWLCTSVPDRNPKKLGDLAEELGVTNKTLFNWRTEDKEFMEEWEKRYKRGIGSPERKQHILDTLYKTATDPDDPKHVQAAEKYLNHVEDAKPGRMDVVVHKETANLSDEDLENLIAGKALAEQQSREIKSA